ncbi:MAG: type III-A CRISPR-associated protein Cas10/Csm1 [Candidatus Heimdallarchaeaceae archaeon]
MTTNSPEDLMNFYRTVEIAALLHDIGKFKYRTLNLQGNKKHQLHSADLIEKINLPKDINKSQVIELVKAHHNDTRNIQGLNELRFSDWVAAGMDREEDDNEDPYQPLECIFSALNLEDLPNNQVKKGFKVPKSYYMPYAIKNDKIKERIFPSTKQIEKKEIIEFTAEAWSELEDVICSLPSGMSFNAWITSVNSILKLYCSNVVSSAYKSKSSISLYNHLVTTAAIARCMVEYNSVVPIGKQEKGGIDEPRFLIISGDINGIQSFIFKMRFPQEARAKGSVRLRGRSFYIELLTDATLRYILQELSLDINCILTYAAGNYKLIAPNTKEVKTKLKKIRGEITDYLLEKFDLDLGITLDWVEVSKKELLNYEILEKKLRKSTELKKLRTKSEKLFNEPTLETITETTLKYFEPESFETNKQKCVVCEAPTPINSRICENCEEHQEIGRVLPKTRSILVSSGHNKILKNNENVQRVVTILDFDYAFVEKNEIQVLKALEDNKVELIFGSLDDLSKKEFFPLRSGINYSNFSLSMPKYRDNTAISFNPLTDASLGIKRLGILKADIDNLGQIFVKGLDKKKDEKKTLSRLRDLSMRLDLFFSYYITKLTTRPKYRLWYNRCEKHAHCFMEVPNDSEE